MCSSCCHGTLHAILREFFRIVHHYPDDALLDYLTASRSGLVKWVGTKNGSDSTPLNEPLFRESCDCAEIGARHVIFRKRYFGRHRWSGICIGCCSNDESARHHKATHALCCSLCSSRYPVAMGFSADNQRISVEDDASELRLHRKISALRF